MNLNKVTVDMTVIWTDPHLVTSLDRIEGIIRNFQSLEPEVTVHRPDWKRFFAFLSNDDPWYEYQDDVFDKLTLGYFLNQSPHGSEFHYIRVALRIKQEVNLVASYRTRCLLKLLKSAEINAPEDSFFLFRYFESGSDLSDLHAANNLSWVDFVRKDLSDQGLNDLWNGPSN